MSDSVDTNAQKSRQRRNTVLIIILLLFIIGLFTTFKETLFGPRGFFNFLSSENSTLTHQDSLRIADSLSRLDSSAYIFDFSDLTAEQIQHLLDSLAGLKYDASSDSISKKKHDAAMTEALRKALETLNLQDKARLDSLQRIADSLALLRRGDTTTNSQISLDSLAKINRERARLDSLLRAKKNADSLRLEKNRLDSLAREQVRLDSLKRVSSKKDTVAPWIYPDPTGGLYYAPVKISFVVSEPCSIYVRFSGESKFRVWNKSPFTLAVNEELFFYGVDSVGNRSVIKSKKYVFEKDPAAGDCPEGMSFINSGDGFCIDKFEWPNKKGAKPISNVSFSEASDSCFSKGKRLCTSSEWESACEGKYNWNYPYGSTYEQHGCVTQESSRKKSGEFGECRGWYAVHDMVGNLAEWTSTPAVQDKHFYIVKGGFWESGKGADCRVERYSYYPQNRHNPVGFRCCREAGNK